MKKSLEKNKIGFILMICSSLCVCTGQLMWKLSLNNIWYLIIGFLLYGIGAFFMLIAYGHGSLSVLQPMLSINYILTIILAYFVLHESICLIKIVGIIFVMIGVFMIGGGDE